MGNIFQFQCSSCDKFTSEEFKKEVYIDKVDSIKKTYTYIYADQEKKRELLENVIVTSEDIRQRLPGCSCL